MTIARTLSVLATLMIGGFVNATADTGSIEVLDLRIADAKNASKPGGDVHSVEKTRLAF
jgi:hypothetical protein